MKRILFGITGLTLGGAERVLVDLANKLCNDFHITIFTIYSKGELEKELNGKIKLKSLYNTQYNSLSKVQKIAIPLKTLFMKKHIYKKHIKENFDVEISFLEGPVTRLFSCQNKNTKKIAWIHNDISMVFGHGIKSKLKKLVDKNIYKKYDKLVFVSKDNLDKFQKTYPSIGTSKSVIYNYIDKEKIIKKAEQSQEVQFSKNGVNILNIARLVNQKGINRLIKVHSKLIKEGIPHNIYVIGNGPLKQGLENIIKQENVENTFKLLGQKENPYPYLKNSNLFCLASYFEGYGMVLEEAKILNKPIIITNTAAKEAIEGYKKSIVVENTEDGIYEGLKSFIQNSNMFKNVEDEKYDNSNILQEVVGILE